MHEDGLLYIRDIVPIQDDMTALMHECWSSARNVLQIAAAALESAALLSLIKVI